MNEIVPDICGQKVAEIAELRLENEILSRQVKRLVKAESKLYEYQEQLDDQLKEYKELYKLNRKLIAAIELRAIFEYAAEYIINCLGYERVIFFQQSEENCDYAVTAIDGYYDQQEKNAVAKLTISLEDPFLSPLLGGKEHLSCKDDTEQHELAVYRTKMHMNEYLFYRLGTCAHSPVALLAVGNTGDNAEFYRRVSDEEGMLLGMGNLVGLLSPMIESKREKLEIQRLNAEMGQKVVQLQEAQEQLLFMNDDLERKVEQRTLELQRTQKQFLHAEKLSAIGKLSASIAHEFNNPLQGIFFILNGLKKRAILQDEDRHLLIAAIDECNRIKDLIRSLQDFYRPSTDRKTLMDVHKSINSLLLLHKSDFAGKKISVVLDYAEQLPQILAVPDQIKQVFLNLLTNAADSCLQRGGLITVSTRQEDNKVAVAIKDTGIGIKPEEMEQLFRPFYTTKPEVKGTGLGLSISYGIVKNHQGEIRIESQPGQGATFTVLLPINGGATPHSLG